MSKGSYGESYYKEENDLMPNQSGAGNCLLNKALLKPIEYPGLIRLGPNGDGGYVIPGDQIKSCELLISLGLSDNWLFDKEFLARNPTARVIGVDHTVGPWWFLRRIFIYLWKIPLYALIGNRRKISKYATKLRNCVGYFFFFREPHSHLKRRVSTSGGRLDISLGQILDSNLGRPARHDVFLKMDIEGSEYGVVQDIVQYQNRIRCIAAEFHDLDKRTEEFNESMQSLSQHFCIVHIHGNNGSAYDYTNDFPSAAEITFINKSLIEWDLPFSAFQYPRERLDFPNNPAAPDYRLHFEQLTGPWSA